MENGEAKESPLLRDWHREFAEKVVKFVDFLYDVEEEQEMNLLEIPEFVELLGYVDKVVIEQYQRGLKDGKAAARVGKWKKKESPKS